MESPYTQDVSRLSLAEAVTYTDEGKLRSFLQEGKSTRANILQRFPRSEWPTMPLERYALGLDKTEDSFSWCMEVGSESLGHMKGGSAHKMLVYKRRNAPGWYFPPRYANEQEAWQAVRSMYVQLFEAASRGDWNTVDTLQFSFPTDNMMIRKTLSVYFPNDLLPIFAKRALTHIGTQLGMGNPEAYRQARVGLNRAVLAAAQQHEALKNRSPLEIGYLIYFWRPPPLIDRGSSDVDLELSTQHYLHISPGERGRFWEEWKQQGIATIGWTDLGDLSNIHTEDEFTQVRLAAQQRNPTWGNGGPAMVWKFRNLEPGDRIIARQGQSQLLGIGIVRGRYFFEPITEYGHRIKVDWVDQQTRVVDYNFGVRSLSELSVDQFRTLAGDQSPIWRIDDLLADDEDTPQTEPLPTPTGVTEPPAIYAPKPEPNWASATEEEMLAHIRAYIAARGYYFSEEAIANYHISLKTRPFVILAGLSGTGKSKLTQLYAEALGCQSNASYLRLAVQPNWTESRYLLGYLNGLNNQWQRERLLDFLLSSVQAPEQMHFCCLDEMNLARVEYYFSPMLSAMEEDEADKRVINLYSAELAGLAVPAQVRLNGNVFFVGTINVDETTQNLSDKVIDRANTLEFYEVDFDRLPAASPTPPEPLCISSTMWQGFRASQPDLSRREQIKQINAILRNMRQSIGYRVCREMELYLANSAGLLDPLVAFDLQVRQRVLPRVRGDHHIEAALNELLAYTEGLGLTRSNAKLSEMRAQLQQDGYTSFFH